MTERGQGRELMGLGLHALFWFAIAAALLASTLSEVGGRRPGVLFYWMLALATAAVMGQAALRLVFGGSMSGRQLIAIVVESSVALLVFVCVPAFAAPAYHSYYDYMYHAAATRYMMDHGQPVPVSPLYGNQYGEISGFHFVAACLAWAAGLSPEITVGLASAFSVAVLLPCAVALIALHVARAFQVPHERAYAAAAIAVTLLLCTRWILFWASNLSTNTFGLGIFALEIIVVGEAVNLFRPHTPSLSRFPWLVAGLVLFGGILATHLGTMGVTLVIGSLVVGGVMLIHRVQDPASRRPDHAGLLLALWATAIAWVIFAASRFFDSQFAVEALVLQQKIFGAQVVIAPEGRASDIPVSNSPIAYGLSLLDVVFLLLGTLVAAWWLFRTLRRGGRAHPGLALALPLSAVALISWAAFGLQVIGSGAKDILLFARWVSFATCFLVALIGVAAAGGLPAWSTPRRSAAFGAIVILAFFAGAAAMETAAADANPLGRDLSGQPTKSFLASEVAGFDALSATLPTSGDVVLSTDAYAFGYLSLHRGDLAGLSRIPHVNPNPVENNILLVRAHEDADRGLLTSRGKGLEPSIERLTPRLDTEFAGRIYDDGGVVAYRGTALSRPAAAPDPTLGV